MLAGIIALSIAFSLLGTALLAWDFGRRWLDDRARLRIQENLNLLAEVTKRLDEQELVRNKLAEDWKRKFQQLEADWKSLKEHADSQFAGAIAQAESAQMRRGFNR